MRATLTSDFVPAAYAGRAALILATAEADAAASVFALKSMAIGPIYTVGFKMSGPLAGDVRPIRALEDVKGLERPFVIVSALPPARAHLVGPLLKHFGSGGERRGSAGGSGNGNGNGGVTAGKVFINLSTEGDGDGEFDCDGYLTPGSQPSSRRGSAVGVGLGIHGSGHGNGNGNGLLGGGAGVGTPGGRPVSPSPSPVATASSLGWTSYDRSDVRAWTQVETLRLLVGQNVPYDFVRLTSG